MKAHFSTIVVDENIIALEAAQTLGVDFMIHSSWCSGAKVFVARVRPAHKQGCGKPFTSPDLAEVLSWAADEARRVVAEVMIRHGNDNVQGEADSASV